MSVLRSLHFATAKGKKHYQQDAMLVAGQVIRAVVQQPERVDIDCANNLFAVADGVSSSPAAHLASTITLESLQDIWKNKAVGTPWLDSRDIRSVQFKLCQRLAGRPQTFGSATTFVLAQIMGNEARILHSGDSRAYLIQADGLLKPLTRDHTAARAMMDSGDIPADNDENNLPAFLRALDSVLVADYDADYFTVDIATFRLQPHEGLLLCSDGIVPALAASLPDWPSSEIVLHSVMYKLLQVGGEDDNVSVLILGAEI